MHLDLPVSAAGQRALRSTPAARVVRRRSDEMMRRVRKFGIDVDAEGCGISVCLMIYSGETKIALPLATSSQE